MISLIFLKFEKISFLKIEFIPIILGLVTIGWGVMFLRWNLLLRNEKIFIPIKDSFLIYVSGFALSIIPCGDTYIALCATPKVSIRKSGTVAEALKDLELELARRGFIEYELDNGRVTHHPELYLPDMNVSDSKRLMSQQTYREGN